MSMSGFSLFDENDEDEAPTFTAFSGRGHRLVDDADLGADIPNAQNTQIDDAEEEGDDDEVVVVEERSESHHVQTRLEELRTMVAAWLCNGPLLTTDPLLTDLDRVMMQLTMLMSEFDPAGDPAKNSEVLASAERVSRRVKELRDRVEHLNKQAAFHPSSSSATAPETEFNCQDFVQDATDISDIIDAAICSPSDADPRRFSSDDEEPLVVEPAAKKARGKAKASASTGKDIRKKPAGRT